ncbi:MAG: hypothetical protein M3285_14160 [Actinomycetota bacterium]|nr:hypothetical protein [Actinomycetota bacterium]MDQ3956677.1 hypothetical protein [Actinomycetota bacterium]
MPVERLFPRRTLENALRVPQAIKQHNAGNPWSTEEVARALDLGPKSGNFFYVTASSRAYGLTEGTRETSQISLTPLGRQAVYPANKEEERDAWVKAFLNVPAFRQVLEYYRGNNLPERQFLSNTLVSQFNIPEDQHDEFVDLFTKNCKFVGIAQNFDVKQALSGSSKRHVRDSIAEAPRDATDDGRASDTVTVDAPEGADDAPVCFVVMPFTERDDSHSPGFFDEVLEQIFTPAAKNAGFLVRTAMRQGSDIIQSTIVNDLLEADLVLCDLTEHNPNVLFELGLRIREEKPVALVKARGTGRVFDVDNMLRVVEYNANLWPSTVLEDVPNIEEHIKATWANKDSDRTFMRILRQQAAE